MRTEKLSIAETGLHLSQQIEQYLQVLASRIDVLEGLVGLQATPSEETPLQGRQSDLELAKKLSTTDLECAIAVVELFQYPKESTQLGLSRKEISDRLGDSVSQATLLRVLELLKGFSFYRGRTHKRDQVHFSLHDIPEENLGPHYQVRSSWLELAKQELGGRVKPTKPKHTPLLGAPELTSESKQNHSKHTQPIEAESELVDWDPKGKRFFADLQGKRFHTKRMRDLQKKAKDLGIQLVLTSEAEEQNRLALLAERSKK